MGNRIGRSCKNCDWASVNEPHCRLKGASLSSLSSLSSSSASFLTYFFKSLAGWMVGWLIYKIPHNGTNIVPVRLERRQIGPLDF